MRFTRPGAEATTVADPPNSRAKSAVTASHGDCGSVRTS
jgi:hypothetical protein